MDDPLLLDVDKFYAWLGDRLRAYRRFKNLRQVEMAVLLDVSYRHYQDIEKGKINLHGDTLLRCLWLINADLGQLRDHFCYNRESDTSLCSDQEERLSAKDELSILIVDDEPHAIQLISESLSEINNWRVMTSSTPREALKIMENQKVDVLITDILMPEINGFDLIRQAKLNKSLLSCITMSGCANREFYESSIEANASAILGKPFEISKLIECLKELAKQKQATQANTSLVRQLRASEIKYRWIFKAAQEALLLVDNNTSQIIDANESCQKVYRLPVSQLLSRTFSSLLADHQPETKRIRPEVQCHLQYHKRSDDSTFPAEVYKGSFHWEGREVSCYSIRDVSQDRICETLLGKNEALFRNLILNMKVALCVCDINGRCLHTNKMWDHLIGMKSGTSMGSLWVNRVHKKDRRQVLQEWKRAKEQMNTFSIDCHLLNKKGCATPVSLSCNPIFDTSKNFYGFTLLSLTHS